MKKVLLLFLIISYSLFCKESYTIIDNNNVSLLALEIAKTQIGVKETAGKNRSSQIDLYNKTAGVSLGSPYCAAGIYWSFKTAADSLKVKNIIKQTASANGQYDYCKSKGTKDSIYKANKSSLIVWKYSNSYNGHIEIINKVLNNGNVETIGFNTSSGASGSQRDGEGVYKRQRNIKYKLGKMLVRGVINLEKEKNNNNNTNYYKCTLYKL